MIAWPFGAGLTWRLVGVIAGFLVMGALYVKGLSDGYARAEAIWQAEVAAIRAAHSEAILAQQAAANEARAEADERVAALIDELDAREDLITELEAEANADPDGDRPALGVDSVHRLNRLLSR